MNQLLALLPYVKADNETLEIAKGKYFLAKTFKEGHRIKKQLKGLANG